MILAGIGIFTYYSLWVIATVRFLFFFYIIIHVYAFLRLEDLDVRVFNFIISQ